MIDISQFGKGAVAQPLHRKDYRLEVATGAVVLPRKFSIKERVGKIKNQGPSLSCVGQSYAYYVEVLNHIETGEKIELSARDNYSLIYLPDGGAYAKDGAAKISKEGNVLEKDAVSYENGKTPSETFMRKRDDITGEEIENGKTYIIQKYVTWDNTNLELFKQAIVQGNGCVIVSWGNNVVWGNGEVVLPDVPSQMSWRHQVYLTGYDDDKKAFEFVNSWGEGWGNKGFGWLPYEYVTQGYVTNPITLIDVPNETYVKLMSQIKNLMEMIIALLKKKLGL
jgi:hypothetical protein